MDIEPAPTKQRRKSSEAVTSNQQAMALVRPFNAKLGEWQARSVKLLTLARHRIASGTGNDELVGETDSLLACVSEEARHFGTLVAEHSDAVAMSGRIADTRRSFQMVIDRLAEAKSLIA